MCQLNWTKSHGNPLPQMTCEIVLNEDSSYSAGDSVSGEVVFNASKSFYTWAVRVALEGCAVVKLGQGPTQMKSETFMDVGENIFGRGEKIAFPAGEKKFKFSLNLSPLNGELPGTMKNSYGFILYQVIIYMKQELRTFKQAEKVITVGSFYSLSHQGKQIFTPVVCENLGKSPSMLQFLGIGSSKGSSDRFGVTFRMNRSGYIRGEEIPFQLDFKNGNNQQISSALVCLLQKTVYSVGTTQKVLLVELNRVERKEISGDETKWIQKLVCPEENVCPSQSGIIDVSYSVTINVTVAGKEEPYILETPIKIGTIK